MSYRDVDGNKCDGNGRLESYYEPAPVEGEPPKLVPLREVLEVVEAEKAKYKRGTSLQAHYAYGMLLSALRAKFGKEQRWT